ncbi:hypothetical protein G3N56_15940 [Desulfovibrio sulfodismutans]|uniref:Uncharacterized protein n=1 Tax=Desulfolutivibrio sulfodismutans TaxID=63561 RepID=A0A7K3NPW0_9BACT|nr:hypothetical protein [Desulfolutivibrio sulfodismutans]NDY58224.1 hypothetical protein [Desulfolutivibrio sulfodismutans]QLA12814.1 hypothetical protein GD606_11295 [Desulfolutivibrio sulfodismutans DSM 3696]
MKPFFALLAVLYLPTLANAGIGILAVPTALALVKNVGDIVLFGLCLRTAFDLAYGRTWLDPAGCRLLYRAVGALGIYAVILAATDTPYGPPGLFGPGLVHAAMVFIPYVLFIVPVVLQEKRLQEAAGEAPGPRGVREREN